MEQNKIAVTLPQRAIEEISIIITETGIYEDHVDFVTRAIINLLEEYRQSMK
jgi:Arc/MetJ-type ribon-helix-helix transcriptional regulator